MTIRDHSDKTCIGLKAAMSALGGKWKITIIFVLNRFKTLRYSDLKRKIPDITGTMLAKSLHELEDCQLIVRTQYNEMPLRVEYSLHDNAYSLVSIIEQLAEWGTQMLELEKL